jgi:hypothetical protein
MASQKLLQSRPSLDSPDQQEERDARVTELMERARRHQQQAEEHLHEVERLKTQGPPNVDRKRG